jgi:hypothetical protein
MRKSKTKLEKEYLTIRTETATGSVADKIAPNVMHRSKLHPEESRRNRDVRTDFSTISRVPSSRARTVSYHKEKRNKQLRQSILCQQEP